MTADVIIMGTFFEGQMAGVIAIERDREGEDSLVRRAQAGDAIAFDRLIRDNLERQLRIAISILGNEADARDVIQDCCVRVWRELPKLREPDRFEAWLTRVVVNACRSALRSRRRTVVREIPADQVATLGQVRDPARSPVEDLSSADAIRRAFARLDSDKRAILVLHHVEGMAVVELARVLGIPEGTAKWRLHAARAALERALEVEDR